MMPLGRGPGGSAVVPRNAISVVSYSSQAFIGAVQSASGAARSSTTANQVHYLADYLARLNTKSLLIESHYIDRHFIEEYAKYYSRCLVQPPNSCVRIHAFSVDLSGHRVTELLRLAARGPLDASHVKEQLQGGYLGFIVIRPLPFVPVGRTVLVPPSASGSDRMHTLVSYPVHLLGLQLSVKGIAFQQQDHAVGACATTALWTALQRLTRNEGGRAPTPAAVTEAASRRYSPEGRLIPSGGLSSNQISEALREFEFGPQVFRPANPEFFRLLTGIYLRSGIPVIMGIQLENGEHHALTAIGYRERTTPGAAEAFSTIDGNSGRVRLTNKDLTTLIVHDDRIGPYVLGTLSQRGSDLFLSIRWGDGQKERLRILMAFAPLYPKLRTTASQLVRRMKNILLLVHDTFRVRSGTTLDVDMFFERAGSYLGSLNTMNLSPIRVAAFQQTAALSRYVAIIRWSIGGLGLIDTVWDTTDTIRYTRITEQMLAVVALSKTSEPYTDSLAKYFSVAVG